MRQATALLLLVSLASAAAAAPPKAGRHEWSKRALLAAIIRQQAIPLDVASPEKGCGSAVGSKAQELTLGEYLAFLVASLESAGKIKVSVICKSTSREKTQSCELSFATGIGTEDPWRYGIRFEVNDTGTIDPATVSCPGAS